MTVGAQSGPVTLGSGASRHIAYMVGKPAAVEADRSDLVGGSLVHFQR